MDRFSAEHMYKCYRLCEDHFEQSQFYAGVKKRLTLQATPTLFAVPNPPKKIETTRRQLVRDDVTYVKKQKVTADVEIPTTPEASTSSQSSTEPLLRKKLKRLQTKIWRLEKKNKPKPTNSIQLIVNGLRQFLPSPTVEFIKNQMYIARRSSKGCRWPKRDKVLALSIYYHSRQAYKLLGQFFKLPTKRSLQRWLQNSNIRAGFNKTIISALSLKVKELDHQDKQCVLTFDEMSIKESLNYDTANDCIEGFEDLGNIGTSKYVANHALVFTVRGLKNKWKQPVGYFLTSGPASASTLQILVRTCISKLSSIGLHINALVCDQGSNNRSFLEKLEKVSENCPFFDVDNQRVYVFYDPPHLLKNIRNNMVKHGFLFEGKHVTWNDVVSFYNFDKDGTVRMAPKLTNNHIFLRPFASMRVNLAAQVLSHSVAAGIYFLCKVEKLPKTAENTANFIDFMDKLFNCFNSQTLFSTQPYRGAIKPDNGHIEFLENSLNILKNITLSNGKQVPCISGWRISIKSLIMLWNKLHGVDGFQYLLTNRLNQDCLENLFSIIRGRGGHRDNPTPQQFRAAFRQIVIQQLFQQSERSNCKLDFDMVLLDVDSLKKTPEITEKKKVVECINMPDDVCDIVKSICDSSNIISTNIHVYIAGYLLKKRGRNCQTCAPKLLLVNVPENSSNYEFLACKKYQETSGLIVPSGRFVSFIMELEKIFSFHFPNIIHMSDIFSRLLEVTTTVINSYNDLYCSVECKEMLCYCVKLYFKIRIKAALRTANYQNEEKPGRRNRKVLKLKHV